MKTSLGRILVGGLALAVLGVGVFIMLSSPPSLREEPADCSVAVSPGPLPGIKGLSKSQVALAATIWQTSHKFAGKLNATASTAADDAAVIAIAVARQESALGSHPGINKPNRDGDAGPFQQRTLPGWYGTLKQVNDPAYAAKTFFVGHTITTAEYNSTTRHTPAGGIGYHLPGLADVKGWAHMSAIDAAHAVQRSAFPTAIKNHLPVARQLVAAFRSGNITDPAAAAAVDNANCAPIAKISCPATGLAVEKGLTPDALSVMRCVHQRWPEIRNWAGVGARPSNVDRDHQEGKAVDIMIPAYASSTGQAIGKKIANWAQANANKLGITYVIWNEHIWSVQRSDEGWRACNSSAASCYHGPDDTAAHRNHVHVSVHGSAGGTDNGGNPAAAISNSTTPGRTTTPIENYTLTATFGQTGSWARYHTGLDFAAPVGTPIRAAAGGTITHSGPGGHADGWAGNYVTIHHADGTQTLYAHMSTTQVTTGQQVQTGQTIGAIGLTGRTFGPHLHFETYPKGVQPGDVYKTTDPQTWLKQQGTTLSD